MLPQDKSLSLAAIGSAEKHYGIQHCKLFNKADDC